MALGTGKSFCRKTESLLLTVDFEDTGSSIEIFAFFCGVILVTLATRTSPEAFATMLKTNHICNMKIGLIVDRVILNIVERL